MGFELHLVCSSQVTLRQKDDVLLQALEQWPVIRIDQRAGDLASHALFSPPELTDYLYGTTAEYEAVIEQNEQVAAELSTWACQFPAVTFVHIYANCFGGVCVYSGFSCRNGEILLVEQPGAKNGHVVLLRAVGITIDDYFKPFARGYFDQ
jgi:hypothetical protein